MPQVAWLESAHAATLAALRPDALPLVDAFGISDFVLNTPLGRADGDVYAAYLRTVDGENSKRRGASGRGAPPYYSELLAPMFAGEDLAAAMPQDSA